MFHSYHCVGDLGAQSLHCHEEVEFVAVYRGQGAFRCGRARHQTGPGVLSIACPQEAHGGAPLVKDFAVKVLNVPVKWFETADLSWHLLWQADAACEIPGALDVFFQAFDRVQENHSRMAQEEALVTLHQAAGKQQGHSRARESARIETAISLLRERFTEDVSLAELAASVELTPTYFCRAFKNAVGLPPHAYQNSLRVARAKVLLEGGKTAGEVATEVGFYDQSHLNIYVKRLLGVTPQALSKR